MPSCRTPRCKYNYTTFQQQVRQAKKNQHAPVVQGTIVLDSIGGAHGIVEEIQSIADPGLPQQLTAGAWYSARAVEGAGPYIFGAAGERTLPQEPQRRLHLIHRCAPVGGDSPPLQQRPEAMRNCCSVVIPRSAATWESVSLGDYGLLLAMTGKIGGCGVIMPWGRFGAARPGPSWPRCRRRPHP